MSKESWNFPCWTTRDQGPDYTRNDTGCVFELGPGAFYNSGTTQPFTDTITAIFSVLIRSGGWTSTDGAIQGIGSVGLQNASDCAFRLSTNDLQDPGGRVAINMVGWHEGTTTLRYNLFLGDENGLDWMWQDKWYQVAVSISPSGMSYAVNGTNSPKKTVATNSPGAVDMNNGNERMWICGPNAAFNVGDAITATTEWPTMIFGASAWTTQSIDLTDSAVLNRIYDTDGQFKNPGENGSLWFGDTYGETIPEFYFTNGTPIHQTGSDTQEWKANRGGGAGFGGCPGGLKKQYEIVIPDGVWFYVDMATAEASGDAWIEGDEIWINGGSKFFYLAALAVDGHSGLIHQDPFNEGNTLSAVTLKTSDAAADPDTWAYTDFSAGTKGVDYEFDTNAGNGRISQLGTGTAAPNLICDTVLTAGDTKMFTIINDLKLSGIVGTGEMAWIYLKIRNAAEDAGVFASLLYHQGESALNWMYQGLGFTNYDTGVPVATQQRLWVYYREDRYCLWTDTDTGPSYTGTDAAVGFSLGSQVIAFKGTTVSKTWDMELGYHLNGNMTII